MIESCSKPLCHSAKKRFIGCFYEHFLRYSMSHLRRAQKRSAKELCNRLVTKTNSKNGASRARSLKEFQQAAGHFRNPGTRRQKNLLVLRSPAQLDGVILHDVDNAASALLEKLDKIECERIVIVDE